MRVSYMAKLTLNIDDKVVARSKRYAKLSGVSVSKLVEDYLEVLSRAKPRMHNEDTPVLKALRGVLRGAKVEDYHRYIEEKYLG